MTARRQLVLAAVLAAAALAGTAVVGALLGGATSWPLLGLAVAVVLAAGGLATTSVRARRSAGVVLGLASTALALAAAVGAGLLVVVLVLGRLPDPREDALVWPVAAGLALAGPAFAGLRRAAADAARRRAAAGGRDPVAVVEGFGTRAARDLPVEELLRQLAESLRRDLALDAVEVWTLPAGRLQRAVAVPSAAGPAAEVPAEQLAQLRRTGVAGEAWLRTWLPQLLPASADAQVRLGVARHGGDVLGLVLVTRPGDGERFTAADERRLADVVGRLGPALHNRALDSALQETLDDLRRTNEELRASRSRLVAAADAERRRIERDIHDGAQQHLVALAVNLGLARDLQRDDPAAAAEVLDGLSADLKLAIGELRDLAHGVYPPLLREAGLAEALRSAAARSASPVQLDAGPVRRHGPEVEAAVYFCCLEALQNSAKHAPGAAVVLELDDADGALVFAVRDDGPGCDPTSVRAGQGVQNMTDRLGAVGGTLEWTSAPGGGTTVRGRVPVATGPVATAAPVLTSAG